MVSKKITGSQFSESVLSTILEIAPVGMVVSDINGNILYANHALMEILGYSEEEIYSPDVIISHDSELETNQQIRQQLLKKPSETIVMEKRYAHKNGRAILCLMSTVAVTDKDGNVSSFVTQIIDIEYRKKVEKSAELFRSMINASRDTMMILDPNSGDILDANIQACESLGYSYQEMLKLNIYDIERKFNDTVSPLEFLKRMRMQKHTLIFGEHIHKSKKVFPVEVSLSYLVQDDFEYYLAIIRDITERKKSEALIWEQANFDALTKLPNRNMLYDRLREGIKKAHRSSSCLAVLSLDLDKFKDVNDTLGHDVGDKLLKEAGERLNQCVRETDTVARLGGDEFCIVIESVEDVSHIDRIANNILKKLVEPFLLDDSKAFISTSIGVAFFPDDGGEADDLLKKSDQAMYFAKSRGRNCFQYFTESMQEKALDRMRLSRDIHEALEKEQFFVEYQPIVSLNNGVIEKAEALLRWQHPERGLINAGEFISIAEENGTVGKIGEKVFAQVIETAKAWTTVYNENFQISINASPLQFREGSQDIDTWYRQLLDAGLSGESVIVEITEGLIMETSQSVIDKLLMLRDCGIQVALDDFGTGYSALSYLQKLDIDYLKIDKSFVENLSPGSDEEVLCQAIIVMAHRLKLQVIAEGIERQEQYELLRAAGCDFGQGFYFSKSLPVSEFEKKLR
jgi:diguanylate cyclase (GGDEF)-like protein/PAS domain S-box-containing protein